MKNYYRITKDTLLVLNNSETARVDFKALTSVSDGKQFVEQYELFPTVWNFGVNSQRLNKVSTNPLLIEESALINYNERCIPGRLLLRQGFSFEGLFGILVVVKGMTSNHTYKSSIYNSGYFMITDNKELIDGNFWSVETNFLIPRLAVEENLMINISFIKFTDIVSDPDDVNAGFISTYPTKINDFTPLISESPIPDYIQTEIKFTNNQYLNIIPRTLELSKTLEQSILDYFGFSGVVVPIEVEHIIKYGTEEFGYRTLKVSNPDDYFGNIVLGLDFTEFEASLISIFVSTEITCNNILMKREQTIIFDIQDIINPTIGNLINGQTIEVFPVKVDNITNIENTIIETNTEVRIIPILQPVAVEMVTSDILFENKFVGFQTVTKQSYIRIDGNGAQEPQYILSKVDAAGKIYFDLTKAIKPVEPSQYVVIDSESTMIVLKGIIG